MLPDLLNDEALPLLHQILDQLTTLSAALTDRSTSPSPDALLTVDEVAALLGVSRRSVDQIIAEGDLKPLYIRSARRFSRSTIDAYLRRCASR